MTVTLGDLLRHRKIKQIDVIRTLQDKYGLSLNQSCFNRMCNKEGDWFSKQTEQTQKCLKNEYGIYYDGSVWRGGTK